MNNIHNIKFKENMSAVRLFQYDTGQVIHFEDDFPDGTELQFEDGSVVIIVDGNANVPDRLLTDSKDIKSYIQIIKSDSETTVYRLTILVSKREKKNDYVEPEDEATFRQQLQGILEDTKEAANTAADSADRAADEASRAASDAESVGTVVSLDKISTKFPSSVSGDVYLYFLGWTTSTWNTLNVSFTQVNRLYKYTPSTGKFQACNIYVG